MQVRRVSSSTPWDMNRQRWHETGELSTDSEDSDSDLIRG